MKKLGLFAASLLMMAMVSCKEEVCIKCTKIADGTDPQELCSRNRDDRQKFQTDLIKAGYNCQTVEE